LLSRFIHTLPSLIYTIGARSQITSLNTTASYFAKLLEKRRGYTGRISELGAIKLESDLAGIVRGGLYGARDALAMCLQICLAVNMEENEVGICSQRRVVVGRMGWSPVDVGG